MYVRGPRLLALPLVVQLRICGHFAASTPDDHDVKDCEARVNRALDAYFARVDTRPVVGPIPAGEIPC